MPTGKKLMRSNYIFSFCMPVLDGQLETVSAEPLAWESREF